MAGLVFVFWVSRAIFFQKLEFLLFQIFVFFKLLDSFLEVFSSPWISFRIFEIFLKISKDPLY